MNAKPQSELELQVVELGDAKEVTMGVLAPVYAEDNPQIQGKLES